VDLQDLGLNNLRKTGNNLEIEACLTLQQLLESDHCPEALKQALRVDSALNIRNAATVAGALVTGDGRSAFLTCMLALDARLSINNGQVSAVIGLSEYLALRPSGLITLISVPINVKTAFATVARSPMDKPIVCASLTQWAGGRTRLALGGYGKYPTLAMDGTEAEGVEAAARNAYHEAGDAWASAEYRVDVAATLSRRCLEAVTAR
jgi:CO/xanthine dehydrogenase FAD-binding subunit